MEKTPNQPNESDCVCEKEEKNLECLWVHRKCLDVDDLQIFSEICMNYVYIHVRCFADTHMQKNIIRFRLLSDADLVDHVRAFQICHFFSMRQKEWMKKFHYALFRSQHSHHLSFAWRFLFWQKTKENQKDLFSTVRSLTYTKSNQMSATHIKSHSKKANPYSRMCFISSC